MPTNAIYDIAQSKKGIMWFLTAKGVVNYNSLNWQLFPDSLELPNTAFSFIKSLEDGSIWVAGQNSKSFVIKYYANKHWQEINIANLPEIEGKFTFDVKIEDQGGYSILICHFNMAFIYDTQSNVLTKTVVSDQNNFSINASSFKNNHAYLSTSEGLWVLDSSLNEHPINELLSRNKEILQLHWNNDNLYLLGLGWLGHYKNGVFNYLSTNTGVDNRSRFNKHNLTIDQFDRIFYSSFSSAKYFDKQSASGKTLYVNGRIFNALSNKIYVDIENNVWVGDHRGLFKFNVLRFKNYNENTELAEDEVTAILQIKDDIILANAKHLNFLTEGSITKKISLGQIDGTRVLDMAIDHLDQIYIASNTMGLLKYDGKIIENINWNKLPDETGITSVEYFNGIIYFTSNHAIYMLNQGEILTSIQISGVRNLQLLNSDTLVALTNSRGFLFYDPLMGDTTRFVSSNSTYNSVYSIVKWRGTYYIATAGGLATIRNGEIVPFYIDEKMNRVAIYSLLVTRDDELWMGTNEGVFIWDGNTLINYNKSYGLVGDEVNRNAFIQDNSGKIWIGTEMGASVYNVDEDLSLKIRPKLHLENVLTQNETVINSTEQELAYDDNTIEFDFLAISFFDEEQITYRYKLDGFDDDWIYINNPNSNSVRYTNLPSGDYKFSVEAGISNNQWSEPESIIFTITKPFYTASWFILLIIILILLVLYTIYRIRFYVILKNQKKLQREVLLRTREIQLMNEEIQAQNEELKTQSEEIVTTNEKLEATVQERTRQLREQNEKLSEYAFINSHELRAPICRIIGLLNLLKFIPKDEHQNILKLIQQTGVELDQISRDINSMLDNVDLTELEELNSIEVINAEKKANQKDV